MNDQTAPATRGRIDLHKTAHINTTSPGYTPGKISILGRQSARWSNRKHSIDGHRERHAYG
ncbi:MAG: hypothetical protein ACM3X0_03075 [Bacteroidota bacterium]